MHTPAAPSDHERAKRGRVVGWSVDAVRRHTHFLMSVEVDGLTGYGYAATFTVRTAPAHSHEFQAARRALIERLRRSGAIRWHWVIEWTRRKVPHLHLSVYYRHELGPRDLAGMKDSWLSVASKWGAGWSGQDAKEISGAEGWLQYLSKHAARGVSHYQRQGKPPGWETTGRLWGYGGEWPVSDPSAFAVDRDSWFRLRRLVRAWRVADARSELLAASRRDDGSPEAAKRLSAARRRLVSARTCLQHREQGLATVRGVREWTGRSTHEALLWLIADDGGSVVQVS